MGFLWGSLIAWQRLAGSSSKAGIAVRDVDPALSPTGLRPVDVRHERLDLRGVTVTETLTRMGGVKATQAAGR